MKFLKNRVLPVVCVFSILVSLCVTPVYAATFPDAYRDTGSVDDINAVFLASYIAEGIDVLAGLSQGVLPTEDEIFWSYVNKQVQTVGEVDAVRLKTICQGYESVFNTTMGDNFFSHAQNMADEIAAYTLAYVFFGEWGLTFSVERHPSSGLLRIYCPDLDWWVTNSAGAYPYVDTNIAGSGGSQWLPFDSVYKDIQNNSAKVVPIDYSVLSSVLADFLSDGVDCRIASVSGKYKAIISDDGDTIWGDSSGKPYVSLTPTEGGYASEEERNPTNVTENGDIVEGDLVDNSVKFDLSDMLVYLPNGSLNVIDNLYYDESTKSYHIDSHDIYNYTQNNYYTWNYYINYTSITYIGQTEEYNKYYEVYYELPDGRDSADLTKEELEQLNLSIDVIPYGRSADDTSLRSLYHFDGDTRDASYWNYCTDFTWNTGASLTYMDAGVFDGALYLDETEHDFTLTLPSNISSGDFTLQFRYYQSATLAPQTDSYITFGTGPVLQFNGGQFLNGNGDVLGVTPVGTWNEVALIRESGFLRFYLNGVHLAGETRSVAWGNEITFHFGDEQQTYKYFDELRVLDFALVTGGANYECTSVPYDTNLSLVLPDSVLPVADEYWDWDTTIPPLFSADFSTGYNSDLVDGQYSVLDGFGHLYYDSSQDSSCIQYPNYLSYSNVQNIIWGHQTAGTGIILPITTLIDNTYAYMNGISVSSEYTFSVVFADGTVDSVTFQAYNPSGEFSYVATSSYDWGSLRYVHSYGFGRCFTYLWICPKGNTPLDIVYVELVAGDTPNTDHEWVESVTGIDRASFNTPTLAVRTDIDITSYQIGGVRPSVPNKGQVWALVENERIVSLQIYNGQAWEGVDGRIWTGQRWVPASSYNIVTLQDMYDIVDATPDFEYIYTETGFWSWWQKSWNAFTEKLFSLLGSGGTGGGSGATGGSGSSGLKDVDLDEDAFVWDPEEEDSKTLWQFIVLVIDGGKSVVSGVRHLFSGVVSTVPETMESITGAFDPGGIAVGVLDGTSNDPDAVIETYSVGEGEVLDPWRYR